ncbi:putative dehydrogenase [Aequitasia blattaphilus]|uniref:Gfo/Idh/MocA family oxidoreductase n=1 Tax=Aequitasia blattaphilus TaxID=2949332 RepID=A0ABT1EBX3_9FIRM|nr:Gfo/Idh/MocA family oxidoreductase [Aequitasia blattaphilus]MCP1102007.1 Gfo/Idh/MocA family oxidoreductase [Aequitasia blattaphilus]MCR8614647.1 Gfo/Idh/MocA family oxidoreductase [Aequitasia blattaphilus]
MRVGIMGAGGIAVKMANTLKEMTEASCYAIVSRSIEKAEEFKEAYGFQKAYGSYEEMVQDEKVDLIYIATPHSEHFENAKLCILNKKPVLCEKSFMVNKKQAEEIVALARQEKVFMAEAIWTRYMPSRKLIDNAIGAGKIGEVISITANLGYDVQHKPRIMDPKLAGGALLDVGIYPLTFASMILGDAIEEIISTCTKADTGIDAANAMILKYPEGKMAILHSSILEATEQYGIVHGTKGYLIAKNINNVDVIEIYNPERELVEEILAPEQISGYEYEVLAAKKAIEEGKTECEEAPLDQSVYMMAVMDEMRKQWGIKYPFE